MDENQLKVGDRVGVRFGNLLRSGKVIADLGVGGPKGERLLRVQVGDPLSPEDQIDLAVPVDWLEDPPKVGTSQFAEMDTYGELTLYDRMNGDGSHVTVDLRHDKKYSYQVDWRNKLYRRAEKIPHQAPPYGDWETFD